MALATAVLSGISLADVATAISCEKRVSIWTTNENLGTLAAKLKEPFDSLPDEVRLHSSLDSCALCPFRSMRKYEWPFISLFPKRETRKRFILHPDVMDHLAQEPLLKAAFNPPPYLNQLTTKAMARVLTQNAANTPQSLHRSA